MHIKTKLFFIGILSLVLLSSFIHALPQGPSLTYLSNSTISAVLTNTSTDLKGTITVLSLNSVQQDYKWKAYVGNVTGKLTLDDSTSSTIYDWSLSTIAGEVYVTRAPSVTWTNISCANSTLIAHEDSALGVAASAVDSINSTFSGTTHKSIIVGTTQISNSTCNAIATYVDDAAQSITEASYFQEVLLTDGLSGNPIYATPIEVDAVGYNNATYDFQMIVAENESSSTTFTYYFYVELS